LELLRVRLNVTTRLEMSEKRNEMNNYWILYSSLFIMSGR